jgi:hypothetical protein
MRTVSLRDKYNALSICGYMLCVAPLTGMVSD